MDCVNQDIYTSEARFVFDVINLPIRDALVCDNFAIKPLLDYEEAVALLSEPDATDEITATGFYTVPIEVLQVGDEAPPAGRMYAEFSKRAEVLDLLLSFANRNRIQVVNAVLEVKKGSSDWQRVGGHPVYPLYPGISHRSAWYRDDKELQGFIQRSYGRMVDEFEEYRGGEERNGLRLSLLALRGGREGDIGEMLYLKTWIALEILVGRSLFAESILSGSRFRRLQSDLKSFIYSWFSKAASEQELSEVEREAIDLIVRKIPELNRRAIADSGHRFLSNLFENYPEQTVTLDDVQNFVRVRNEITHTGVGPNRNAESYGFDVGSEHFMLLRLVERAVLAILGEHPLLMKFEWKGRNEP